MWKTGDEFRLARAETHTPGGEWFRTFCRKAFHSQEVLTVHDVGRNKVYVADGNECWELGFDDIIPCNLENE